MFLVSTDENTLNLMNCLQKSSISLRLKWNTIHIVLMTDVKNEQNKRYHRFYAIQSDGGIDKTFGKVTIFGLKRIQELYHC